MSRRQPDVFLRLLALGAAATLICLLTGGRAAELAFALLAAALPVTLIALATRRERRRRGLALPLAALLLLLEGSVVGLLLLRGRVLDGPWLAGLPAAVVLQLAGLCLAPLLLVALAFGLTFDESGLTPEDLERLPRQGRAATDAERR